VKQRILVVEDDSSSREMLFDWLELQGFRVDCASSVADALLAVEYLQPQAVLLDVKLGKEDGLAVAAWIREQQPYQAVPVIAVTAHAMLTEQERILKAGCNACISKPVEFELLAEQLQKWLRVASNKAVHVTGDKQKQTFAGKKE
jgi:CheY-like chemotaxis protein